jgi:hypothetical protein
VKHNNFARKCSVKIVLKKKYCAKKESCARVKFFRTKISGKCNVTGAIFCANFHKK